MLNQARSREGRFNKSEICIPSMTRGLRRYFEQIHPIIERGKNRFYVVCEFDCRGKVLFYYSNYVIRESNFIKKDVEMFFTFGGPFDTYYNQICRIIPQISKQILDRVVGYRFRGEGSRIPGTDLIQYTVRLYMKKKA